MYSPCRTPSTHTNTQSHTPMVMDLLLDLSVIHRRATGRFGDQICSTAIIYLHVQDRAPNDRNMCNMYTCGELWQNYDVEVHTRW